MQTAHASLLSAPTTKRSWDIFRRTGRTWLFIGDLLMQGSPDGRGLT